VCSSDLVDQPTDEPPVLPTLHALTPPVELPGCITTVGLLLPPKPRAEAGPKPAEVAGPALVPGATLSKLQAVRVLAALVPDSEAISIDAIQTRYFIFI